jgi:hypothetical protein
MSLADNKRNVIDTIGAYTSFMQQNKLPKRTDTFPSINNKKDIVPFLLDTLKTIAGSEALKEVIGGMLTKVVDTAEPKVKDVLKKQFVQSNAGDTLGTDFTNNGVTMPVSDIDISKKFRVPPTSDQGSLLYNTTTNNFDKIAYNAIASPNVSMPYNNMAIKYNNVSDTINIKPTSSVNIGQYFTDYIDNAQIINKKELVSNILDRFYGTMSSRQKKTVDQIYDELVVEKLLEQAMNDDDSFELLPEDYDALTQKARETANGIVTYDLGCGDMPASLPFSALTNTVQAISGSTDPFVVGNAVEATIDASTTNTPTTTAANKQTIKDGFFQKIINIFGIKLLQAIVTAPQIRSLLAISSSLSNGGTVIISKASEDMKKFKTFINCMIKEIMRMIAEFIFALAIAYLIKLLAPIIQKIIKEKINQYVGVLKSLTPAAKLTG